MRDICKECLWFELKANEEITRLGKGRCDGNLPTCKEPKKGYPTNWKDYFRPQTDNEKIIGLLTQIRDILNKKY